MRAICLAAAMWWTGVAGAAPAVVLVVRHAEKAALPADDPPLSEAGTRRAAELARVVEAWTAAGAPVRALIASEVKRTQLTLTQLSAATHVKVTVVAAKDYASLRKQLLAVKGGIAVVAGHSNTLPAILEALGGPAGIVIGDAEYDRLFAITGEGSKPRLVELRYGEPSDPKNASKM